MTVPHHAFGPSDPASDLRAHLRDLLGRPWYDARLLEDELRALAGVTAGGLYHELLRELATLDVNPDEGADHWEAVIRRQKEMTASLGRPVDVRAALLDWLLEADAVHGPKIVEIGTFGALEESVQRDGLTGLHNFRFFEEHLRRELNRSTRGMAPVSLAMIDVDHFKQFNDRHGHEAGNQALAAVARVMEHCVRQNDVCARYGGEEFAVVLSGTSKTAAAEALERLRRSVEERAGEIAGTELPQTITVSVGIATCPGDATEAQLLVERADAALYRAKEGGRNRVCVHGDTTRSYRRAEIRLNGRFRSGPERGRSFTTTSVGDGGFSMLLESERPVGSVMEVSLEIPGTDDPVPVAGRVVYARPEAGGAFETGIKIIDVDHEGRDALTDLLHEHDQD
jgi:diguanylate cyclase (GGDEF)-like protein